MFELEPEIINTRDSIPASRAIFFLCLLGLILLLPAQTSLAEQPDLTLKGGEVNLGYNLYILSDPEVKLTIADLTAPAADPGFKPNHSGMVTMEGCPAVVWLRFDPGVLIPRKGGKVRRVLEMGLAELDSVNLYLPDPSDPVRYRLIRGQRREGGDSRTLAFRNYSFRLNGEMDPARPVYLRLVSYGYNSTPVYLWTDSAFRAYANHDFIGFGLLYGIMFSMILYNLFIWFTLRTGAYLAYVFYMLSTLVYFIILNGHFSYFTGIEGEIIQSLEFSFLGLFMLFSVTFCKIFCDTRENLPLLHKIIIVFQGISLAIITLGVLRMYTEASVLAIAAGVLGPINLIIIGVARYRQGFGPAKYFLAASLSLVLGITVYVLWTLGLLPLSTPGNIYITMGPAIESILLSFALADRIKLLELEKADLANTSAIYKKASETDSLTGLYNKGYLLRRLDSEVRDAARSGSPFSCLIIDVDDFKRFNDTYGHLEGDTVLKTLAEVIREGIRDRDTGGRYGGEEFTVLFHGSTKGQAFGAAERIRRAFGARLFLPQVNTGVSVTVSMGLAQLRPKESPKNLIQRADLALYKAKSQGKNQVVTAE